jgi:hypothetical protein
MGRNLRHARTILKEEKQWSKAGSLFCRKKKCTENIPLLQKLKGIFLVLFSKQRN